MIRKVWIDMSNKHRRMYGCIKGVGKDRGRGQPWGFGKGVWGVGVGCWPFRPPGPPGSGGCLTKHAVITIYGNII